MGAPSWKKNVCLAGKVIHLLPLSVIHAHCIPTGRRAWRQPAVRARNDRTEATAGEPAWGGFGSA
eukprot:4210479-Prymnesium_polylepis.1